MADPSYDAALSTDKDNVRLLISDIGGEDNASFLFKDTEIQGFINLRGGNVFRAAATALRVIASNRVQVAQRILYLGLQTDGPSEADALRKLASDLDEQADNSDVGGGFEIARIAYSGFGPRI